MPLWDTIAMETLSLHTQVQVCRVAVIFNNAAGGVTEADEAILIDKLRGHGIDAIDVFSVDQLQTIVTGVTQYDRLIVLGGDGTARAAAALAPPDGPPLILLPGGTVNALPHALLGPGKWPEVLDRALLQGEVAQLTGGTVNGQRFFLAAMFGTPTILARAREAVREGKFLRMGRQVQTYFKKAFAKKLVGRPDGGRITTVEAIGVLCDPLFGHCAGTEFEWVHLDATNYFELGRAGLGALGPNWRNDPAIQAQRCTSGTIRGPDVIPAILDGEPQDFLSPLHIRFLAEGPPVIIVPSADSSPPP